MDRDVGRPGCMISAEEFVGTLFTVDPGAWRATALAVMRQPGLDTAVAALDAALATADRVRLWSLEDDVESALFRLTTHEAAAVVHGSREFQCIRAATWRAAEALACDALDEAARQLIAGPFIALRR